MYHKNMIPFLIIRSFLASPQSVQEGDRKMPGNYIPISLTSVVGIFPEAIIRDKLVNHLESKYVIRDSKMDLDIRDLTLHIG